MTSIHGEDGAAQAAPLSNYLADLAETVRAGLATARAKTLEAATAYIGACAALAEARGEAKHGEWGAFLRRAGVGQSTARAMVQIARAEVKPARLAAIGVKAVRRELAGAARAEKPLPDSGFDGAPGTAAAPDVQGPGPAPAPGTGPAPDDVQGPASGRQARYRRRRATGACADCGAPAGGRARCQACAAAISTRRRRRRALASVGEAIIDAGAARIIAAAQAGKGAALGKAETARLAAALAAALAGAGRPRAGDTGEIDGAGAG